METEKSWTSPEFTRPQGIKGFTNNLMTKDGTGIICPLCFRAIRSRRVLTLDVNLNAYVCRRTCTIIPPRALQN